MILPLSLLPQLHIKKRKKYALALLFGAGLLIVLVAGVRITFTKPLQPVLLAIFSLTESTIAILVASIPTFYAKRPATPSTVFTQPHSERLTQRLNSLDNRSITSYQLSRKGIDTATETKLHSRQTSLATDTCATDDVPQRPSTPLDFGKYLDRGMADLENQAVAAGRF